MMTFRATAFSAVLASSFATSAMAAPGDLHEVTADLVNLRANPSDAAAIRDRVEGGTQVIELRQDGGWIGIRVVPTGQEGWIYGELLRQTDRSGLGSGDETAGFAAYSQDFDALMHQVHERLGVATIETISQDANTLVLTPSSTWLRASSQGAQVLAATAVYGMWKNHQDQAPVRVVMHDETGEDYVVIEDVGEAGPQLTVIDEASGSEG